MEEGFAKANSNNMNNIIITFASNPDYVMTNKDVEQREDKKKLPLMPLNAHSISKYRSTVNSFYTIFRGIRKTYGHSIQIGFDVFSNEK